MGQRFFDAQALANTAWSVSTLLGLHTAPLAAGDSLAQLLPLSGYQQHVSNTSWSFLESPVHDGPMAPDMPSPTHQGTPSFVDQAMANTAWSFAMFAIVDMPLCYAVWDGSLTEVIAFCPQHMSNTAWADTPRAVIYEPLVGDGPTYCFVKVTKFNPQNMATAVWAFHSSSGTAA